MEHEHPSTGRCRRQSPAAATLMSLPRWLPVRCRTPQPGGPSAHATTGRESVQVASEADWFADGDVLARLHETTLIVLDLVDNVLDDDFTLAQALAGAGDHAADALGIPPAIATLAVAAAADRIVRSTGHPARDLFDPSSAVSLTRISSLGIEDQQRLVKDALRHSRVGPQSPSVSPVPTVKPPQHGPHRNR
ncbi:hypothetical protein ACIP4W_11810 [Streptomyces sp. NPDC088846]|uniref:hypothetical protein n=1 Tax=Streptomyces sp. NPDC088846 TaxID=3365908 RepID=UPI00381BA270